MSFLLCCRLKLRKFTSDTAIHALSTNLEKLGLLSDNNDSLSLTRNIPKLALNSLKDLHATKSTISNLQDLVKIEEDLSMIELINSEIAEKEADLVKQAGKIRNILAQSVVSEEDKGNAVIEIRAGTGGSEASLFASEILEMYEKYCQLRGWKVVERMKSEESIGGGIKEAIILVQDDTNNHELGPFAQLKWESGVHRVQRVPETDAQGRIHTSTITVAVLPEDDFVHVQVNEKDLRIDSFKSSGPGGQHVNKTNSAIRITHLPSGIAVAVQEERSAQQNKTRAMKMLTAKLYEIRRTELSSERKSIRQSQIGGASRSEKIRTYNFPHGRITDHRLGKSIHDIDGFMMGKQLDEFISPLVCQAEDAYIQSLLDPQESGAFLKNKKTLG